LATKHESFEKIVMNNQNWLLRYVLSIVKNEQVAEDIVQDSAPNSVEIENDGSK